MTLWDVLVVLGTVANVAMYFHAKRLIAACDRRRADFWAFYEDSLRAHGIKTTHMVSLPGGKQ